MVPKSWILILILILTTLPAFATSEPFNPGDVLATKVGVFCGPNFSSDGFGVALYRRGAVFPSSFGPENFRFPGPTGPVTYAPALNRMILSTYSGPTYASLETLDTDGHMTPLLTLPERAKATALAGVGREILAVVVLYSPSYRFELWRIAAADGTVTEQIGLPFSPPPFPVRDITSIDLAGDRCTLAYAVPGEVVHRYDICARRPLEDVATGPASVVHFLPQGSLLVVEGAPSAVPTCSLCDTPSFRLARYDREGRLVSTADRLGEWIRAIALDPDGSTAWIVTASPSGCGAGSLMAINVATGALIAGPWPVGGTGVAVAGEWRAAAQPPARGRAIR
jgi:hypothetical protein